jgi:hypothetical protein
MTTPSKAALRAELEAALANYRGPVKQCPAAPRGQSKFLRRSKNLSMMGTRRTRISCRGGDRPVA